MVTLTVAPRTSSAVTGSPVQVGDAEATLLQETAKASAEKLTWPSGSPDITNCAVAPGETPNDRLTVRAPDATTTMHATSPGTLDSVIPAAPSPFSAAGSFAQEAR